MTTTATLAGLVERLRAQARFQSIAYCNLGKPVTPDDTPQGQAATAIETLLARIAALEEVLSETAELLADLSPGFIWGSMPYNEQAEQRDALVTRARAALTLKENDA